MKTRMLTLILALAMTALPCQAQTKPKPEKLPVPKEEPTLPAPEPCGSRVLWVDYWVPVQTLHLQPDYVRTEKIATFALEYKPEERTFTTTVLRPKDITREETYSCIEPVKSIDPATGSETTCMQQVTRTRLVKDTIFEAVPEVQKVTVMVARLVPVTEEVKHTYTLYQWKTDMVKKGCAISVPGAIVPNTQHCVVAPKPELPCDPQ